MDDRDEEGTPLGGIDAEIKELLGLFDVPAFARRGQDLEYSLARLRLRSRRVRGGMLDMVRLRLRQWASLADGPRADSLVFAASIAGLWPLAEVEPPKWAARTASPRKLRGVARDLIASAERFNRRWLDHLDGINLDPINRQVDDYNRYYLLEKECSLGSARLAARHFVPKVRVTLDELRLELPPLPVPVLKA
jgi:hypothetical protein